MSTDRVLKITKIIKPSDLASFYLFTLVSLPPLIQDRLKFYESSQPMHYGIPFPQDRPEEQMSLPAIFPARNHESTTASN